MNEAQQLRWEASSAQAWYDGLMPAERWRLDAKYATTMHDNRRPSSARIQDVYRAEGHNPGNFPHAFYDPPSRCRCAQCEPEPEGVIGVFDWE